MPVPHILPFLDISIEIGISYELDLLLLTSFKSKSNLLLMWPFNTKGS